MLTKREDRCHPRRRAAQQRTGGSQRTTSPASGSHPRRPFSSCRAGRLPWFPFGSAAAPAPPPSSGPALGAEREHAPQARPLRWRDAGFRAHAAGPGGHPALGTEAGRVGCHDPVAGRGGGGGPGVSRVRLHVAADAAVHTDRARGRAGWGPGRGRKRRDSGRAWTAHLTSFFRVRVLSAELGHVAGLGSEGGSRGWSRGVTGERRSFPGSGGPGIDLAQ